MKKLFSFCFTLFLMSMVYAQSPDAFQYQAVVRDGDGMIMANQEIGVQIRLLLNASDGSPVYTEEHTVTTNAFGLIKLQIGEGGTTDDFSSIDWSAGTYFMEVSTDISGGKSYQLVGVSQILSVPYALHAKTAEEYTETDPVYAASEAAMLEAGDAAKLANLSGINTGDQDIGGIATNTQAIKDTASQIRGDMFDGDYSHLTNTPTTISTTQADAIAANSGKDTTGIFHANRAALDLVSGTNTGDQDLSGIATNTQAIKDTAISLTAYIDELKAEIDELRVDAGAYVLTDIDGNTYNVVQIGEQTWMAENLKVTHYSDGSPIALITDNTTWGNLGDNDTDKAYCFYNNDEYYSYGVLYTYAAATNGDNSGTSVQGVCPTGWHLPSDAEWTVLTDFISSSGHRTAVALKTITQWAGDRYGNGRDNYGFAGLPGGFRINYDGIFTGEGESGMWWSSTQLNSSHAYYRYISNSWFDVYRLDVQKSQGCNVRCIKDQ